MDDLEKVQKFCYKFGKKTQSKIEVSSDEVIKIEEYLKNLNKAIEENDIEKIKIIESYLKDKKIIEEDFSILEESYDFGKHDILLEKLLNDNRKTSNNPNIFTNCKINFDGNGIIHGTLSNIFAMPLILISGLLLMVVTSIYDPFLMAFSFLLFIPLILSIISTIIISTIVFKLTPLKLFAPFLRLIATNGSLKIIKNDETINFNHSLNCNLFGFSGIAIYLSKELNNKSFIYGRSALAIIE
jgi:hypothetical protein